MRDDAPRAMKRKGLLPQGYQDSRLERKALRDPGLVSRAGGRALALETGKRVISHETIYRFIYAQLARKKATPGVSCPSASRNVGGGVVAASFFALRTLAYQDRH